jgi:hypothetical protein
MRTRMDNERGRRDSQRTMTTRWSLRQCALLLVLLFLALCASSPSSVVAAPYPAAVVIGVILPLSGPTAAAGQRVRVRQRPLRHTQTHAAEAQCASHSAAGGLRRTKHFCGG